MPLPRAAAALLLVLLAACEGGIELGQRESTTTSPTSTTASTAPSTTTTTRARKALTTTTTRSRAAAAAQPSSEGAPVEITPEDLRMFLLDPSSGWADAHREYGAGPIDFERAAAEEVDEGVTIEEAREALRRLGFVAGYSGAWEMLPASGDTRPRHHAVHAVVRIYLFSSTEGADAYRDALSEAMDEASDPDRTFTVGDVPGAHGWLGGDDDNGYHALVVYTVSDLFVAVQCESTTQYRSEHRTCAYDMTKAEYDHIVEVLESAQ